MIGIIAAVCCVLLIKKDPEALNITASVEMNGIKRDTKENELVNKLSTFSSPNFEILEGEDTSCYMESRFRIEKGEIGEWRKGLIISSDNVLYGTYLFEFRYTCKENTSEVKTLKVVVDPSLPDIFFKPKSNIIADRWIFIYSKFP